MPLTALLPMRRLLILDVCVPLEPVARAIRDGA